MGSTISVGAYVLRTYAEADEAGSGAAEESDWREKAQEQGWLDGAGVSKEPGEQVVGCDLEGLCDACGELAAALDVGQGDLGDEGRTEWAGEDVGCGYSVLDGEVDAEAAYGRHRVGGVADAEQSGEVPALETVDLDREQIELIPGSDLGDAVGEEGDEMDEGLAEGGQAGGLDRGGEGVLGDDVSALEVVSAIDEDEAGSVVEVAESVRWIAGGAAESEPEDVDGGAAVYDGKFRGGAHDRLAAIAADGQAGTNLDWAVGGVGLDAQDAAVLFDEADYFVFEQEAKSGELGGLRGEEFEEVPLRHQGDEVGLSGKAREVCERKATVAEGDREARHLLMRNGQEGFEEAELPHQLESGWMDCVAAKVAEEVLVFFEHGDLNPGAGQEEAEHYAGWTSTDDAAGGRERAGTEDCGHGDTLA